MGQAAEYMIVQTLEKKLRDFWYFGFQLKMMNIVKNNVNI